ncbi:PD-(D/E)XK nuclease family protein [Thermaerobacter subterraneus]|uniref:ATP-dependent nuclease, subunit B n=1 Tax=Thermaerobacter subterraneus DSM 13965 TaxID=867903 RepID=K6NYV4_9FIRM|nr:PD-(D/E)XK nuclease family protein [Thermaerobacter subterraneus]EKP94025.1 ATP-dependent nuclease, subunit B [Thermaerobacter subterraneus DSM 13965]
MSLRLVLGRAGSGKTHYCLEAVAAAEGGHVSGPALVLLVPEQATFQMEQALLAAVRHRTGRAGFARARVASFQRLAWWVQQETGGATRPAVSELGKRLILRALLSREAHRLQLFHRVADRPGFIDRMVTTLAELAAFGIDAEALRRQREAWLAEGREGLLAVKLHDLALLLEAYQGYLEDEGLADPVHALDSVARRLGDCAWLRGARIWVDGFTGFTPGELRVLGALLAVADRVEVTLCLDPAEAAWAVRGQPPGGPGAGATPHGSHDPDAATLFHPTWQTARQLLELARRQRVTVEPAVTLPPEGAGQRLPRFRNPALAHLERELFRFPGRRFTGAPDGITVVAAPDRRSEVAAAAREMLRLAREEGYRFRDMVVIVRDLDAYHDLISAACAEHGIPLFIDRRRPVGHHPLVELVRAAVEVVAADWPYEAVFRYLKTDLVPVARGAVDRLENYVLAFGIRGSLWYRGQPWRWRRRFALDEEEADDPAWQAELEAINRIREEATAALRNFHHRVAAARRQPVPVKTLAEAVHQLLLDLDVPGQILRWSEEAERAGDLEAAQEHLQVWNGIGDLLEQAATSLPDLPLTLADFLRVLEAGMEGLRVGLIPPGLDQVVAGSVERSRHPSARVAFLLGATDDAFPRRIDDDAIFTDGEREELAQAGLELNPPGRIRALHEQYHAYVALTRARDRLWVSYPLGDEEGRAITPAWLTRRLRVLFPALAVTPAVVEGPEGVATASQAVDQLVRMLGRQAGSPAAGEPAAAGWRILYQWAVTEPEARPRALQALQSLVHSNQVEPLGQDLARQLYARPRGPEWEVRTSVSRLERLAACPFQHFAAHGLGLKEREISRLDAPQLGRIYHAALSLLARRVWERGLDWADLDEEALEQLVGEAVEALRPRLAEELATSTAYQKHLLATARRTLVKTASRLAHHARQGRFRPVAVEVDFGPESPVLPAAPWRVGPGEHLALRGRIDRIDAASSPSGRWFLRVIDYKSSSRDLPLDRVYYGLSLQLPLYLLVATRAGRRLLSNMPGVRGPTAGAPASDPEPAGLLFFPVHDPYLDVKGPLDAGEIARLRAVKQLRPQGWVLDDDEVFDALGPRDQLDTLVPVRFRKDGRPEARSRVLGPERLDALFRHVEGRVRAMAGAMLAGRADVAPYRLRDESPCSTCRFRAVCQFDPRVPGNHYRSIRPLSARDVWERLEGAGGTERDGREGGEGG